MLFGGGVVALVEPVRFFQAYFHSTHNTNPRGKTVIFLLGVRAVITLVEAAGVEPASENLSIQLSPGAVYLLRFPSRSADKQALPEGIP